MTTGAPTFAIPTKNALIPPEGPKCVPLNLDFSAAVSYDIDLSNMMALGGISLIQGVFIDNSSGVAAVSITPIFSDQVIFCPAGWQGYFPLLVPSNQAKFTIISNANPHTVNMFLYNMPLPAAVWPGANAATSNVSDPAVDALIAGGYFPSTAFVYATGDTIKPKRGQGLLVSNSFLHFGTRVTITLATGNPYFFMKQINVSLSGDSYLAVAGIFNITLADGASTLWTAHVALPGAAPASPLAPMRLLTVDDFDYASTVNASTLVLSCDNVDFKGYIDVNCTYGLTTIHG